MKPAPLPLRLLGSFGLSVGLLFGLFFLTYAGTRLQVFQGLFEVQRNLFESWIAWVHLGAFYSWLPGARPTAPIEGPTIPVPGGLLLMILLAANLTVGGLYRIAKSKRTLGIIVVHVGIAILLGAGLVKLTASDDGFLALVEGEESDEFISHFRWEVVVYDAADPRDVRELLIPFERLRELEDGGSQVFRHADLPFELELSRYVRHGRVLPTGPMWTSPHPTIDGYATLVLPPEGEAEANIPVVYASARSRGGEPLGQGILWGAEAAPWTVAVGDELYGVSLRKERYTMPFTVRLVDFHKEEHPRTNIPAVYRSDIEKVIGDEVEPLRIEMNRPLRDGGLVLFQSSYGERQTALGPRLYSQFAVVRNPSDHWPLVSCIVIAVGLLLAFGLKLAGYLKRQLRAVASAAEVGQ